MPKSLKSSKRFKALFVIAGFIVGVVLLRSIFYVLIDYPVARFIGVLLLFIFLILLTPLIYIVKNYVKYSKKPSMEQSKHGKNPWKGVYISIGLALVIGAIIVSLNGFSDVWRAIHNQFNVITGTVTYSERGGRRVGRIIQTVRINGDNGSEARVTYYLFPPLHAWGEPLKGKRVRAIYLPHTRYGVSFEILNN